MFLVRSAFWLTVAFLVIKPGVDLDRTAGDLSARAVAAGQQLIVQQIAASQCSSLTCVGGKAVLAAAVATPPSAGLPMQAPPAAGPVPLPRPRPDQAG